MKNFIILFYTDGWASYPQDEILSLKNCGINFRFYGYCEIQAERVFVKMCQELRGFMNENVQTEKIGNSFIAVMNTLRAHQ